jgi:hypothetical protein
MFCITSLWFPHLRTKEGDPFESPSEESRYAASYLAHTSLRRAWLEQEQAAVGVRGEPERAPRGLHRFVWEPGGDLHIWWSPLLSVAHDSESGRRPQEIQASIFRRIARIMG